MEKRKEKKHNNRREDLKIDGGSDDTSTSYDREWNPTQDVEETANN